MRRLLAFVLGALLTLIAPAEARMHAPYRGHRIVPGTTAPLDSISTPAAAYSFRKLRSAYTGPAIRLRRASDNLETDINFLGFVPGLGAPLDVAAATAHCAATSCFVRTWYDQSGSARNLAQATAANQPALVFNCLNSVACLQLTTATQQMIGPSVTPATGVLSASVVAARLTGTGYCGLFRVSGLNQALSTANGTANIWWFQAAAGTMNVPVADAAWHSFQGAINGASSYASVDGTTTTGTLTGATTAGTIAVTGITAGTADCREGELVIWDNYALTAGEAAALRANQKSFWGTP
jgi:hypothetical protein